MVIFTRNCVSLTLLTGLLGAEECIDQSELISFLQNVCEWMCEDNSVCWTLSLHGEVTADVWFISLVFQFSAFLVKMYSLDGGKK